ncbi:MAG: hypothetical protein A3J74_02940 [Elusimicrobia bacterium RIFCSPHIGHO2_02_FULL_57_9]|nr:MAG: hypothetical protein A3J74_02940 [Elusimicrobia bacterium RIFCSPHIGHO2_02_FULL_57_9]
MPLPLTRLHLVVHGRVQGIGYRWFVHEKASEFGLTGWVANRRDGSVEIEAEGEGEALAEFAGILKTDHPYARVDDIETKTLPVKNSASFEIR